ncbi:MAG: hypothetical protein IJV71_07590 [Lachnospiraceae bacterium]|nr:hypothetical protein [Lachnospiraceae bacterium]
MGFKDFFSNISEWDINDFQQGGIIGASMGAKMRKQAEEKRSRPKPGKYCRKVCDIDDERCAPCLEIQRRLEKALGELQVLEESMELTGEQVQQKMLTQKKITNCTLCSAPIEQGYNACPYCETVYPEAAYYIDIPVSKGDRNTLLNEKIQESWNILAEKIDMDGEYMKATAGDDWIGKIQKTVGSLSGSMKSLYRQNPAEITKGAKHYGVSVAMYIHGCASEEMKIPKALEMEEQSRKLEEQRRQQNAQFVAQQQQRAATQTTTDPYIGYLQRRGTPSYGYSGGPNKSCGDCRFYMTGDGKCAKDDRYRSASEYCGLWRLK